MGGCCSKQITMILDTLDKLGLDFTPDEWLQVHNTGTVEESKSQLAAYGTDLLVADESSLPSSYKKAVFICCNTYTKPEYSLGVGPLNDSKTVANYMKTIGFDVTFVHNPKAAEFKDKLKYMLAHTTEYLLVYYSGHGASVTDDDGDEADGKDEALVFDDAFVNDDALSDLLANSGKKDSCKVCLLNDCCHSGTIWDLSAKSFTGKTMPQNILSLSAARDAQTAKQTSMDGKDQGIFTFYFFKFLKSDPKMTPTELESKINGYISKYEQYFTKCATTDSMFSQPLFQ